MAESLDSLRQIFSDPVVAAWWSFGVLGTLIFNSRFYVQWYVSERQRRSVVPVAFWYLSGIGALILLIFAVHNQSPNGALSYSLNSVIYSRNLVHIWREKGGLTRARSIAFQSIVALVTCVSVTIVLLIWWREIEITRDKPQPEAVANWLWIGVGVLGNLTFAGRFIIQWIATELKRKSTMPNIFWHLSVVAAFLQCASFTAQREWLYALGPILNVPVYVRNLWLIYRHPERAQGAAGAA